MNADPETTYVAEMRRGFCSCGGWRCYGVSAAEFEISAKRHLGWHALRDRRATVALRSESAFERTLRAIRALPTHAGRR